jgi:hypothetical protein
MQLQPCVGCRRHVVAGAASCPFCGQTLVAKDIAARPHLRLSRAAVFIAATATGCWTSKTEPKHVEQQQAVVQDAGIVDAPVAQDNLDIERDDDRRYQNHPCVDTPQGPMCAPYGAPPKRRRVV